MALNSTNTFQKIQREDINIAIPIQEEEPKFKITQQTLANIVELYNHNSHLLGHEDNPSSGGFFEIVNALQSDIHCGLKADIDDLCERTKSFGSNHISQEKEDYSPREKSFYGLPYKALKDTSIILLICCAVLSLAIGIKRNGPQEGFSYGLVLLISIFVFVNIRFTYKHLKVKWLAQKHTPHDDLKVGVLRNGEVGQIDVCKIVVGDVLCLKKGDQVPVDGLFIDGETLMLDGHFDLQRFKNHKHPSIFQGEKVVEGYFRILVTAVGDRTENKKLMRSSTICSRNKSSKLQNDIDKLNSKMQKIFLSLSLIVLLIQFFRCFLWESGCDGNHNPDPKGVKNTVEEIMAEGTKIIKKKRIPVNRLVSMLCILVFSLRDGLPLGIFICLAYASKVFTSHGFMVHEVDACATIGLVNTICIDTTSDLVLHPSKMAGLWIGFERIQADPIKTISLQVLSTFREGVGLDMCYFAKFALSFWAEKVLGVDIGRVKENCRIVNIENLDEDKNLVGFSIIRNGEDNKDVHVHWRGVPNRVLSMCSHYYKTDGTMQTLDQEALSRYDKMIKNFGSDSLQCIAFAYRKVCMQEKEEAELDSYKALQHGLTLLGLIILKKPYPGEIMEEIKFIKDLGKDVKLMVADDVEKSTYIAINSGILKVDEEENTDGMVIEAPDFSVCSKEEKIRIIKKTHVMSRCTPRDRLSVVQCLRDKGDVVATILSSSRDSVTLKEADLGIFWGENETGKGYSDIFLSHMNLSNTSSILKLGVSALENLQKFLQLQLTINISAFTINFIVVILSAEVPLGPFELLWVNMVMDIFGAFALGEIEEMPQPNDFKKPRACLVTKSMWINIAFQSLYQVIVLLILNFRGIFFVKVDQKVTETMVFNCFMILQVFGIISAKMIDQKRTIFKIMATKKRNVKCIVCVMVIFVLQIVAVETTIGIFHFGRLNLTKWCICIGIGAISLPIGWFVRCFCLQTKL